MLIKAALYRLWLPRILKRRCGDRIPRSGEEGKKVNCFSVAVDCQTSPYLLVEECEEGQIIASEWDGSRYSEEVRLPLEQAVASGELRITHYYGLAEIVYTSILDFTFQRITGWEYLKVHLWWGVHQVGQWTFNHRKLVTKRRIELLRFLIENQLACTHKGIGSLELMGRLYSIKWVLHPQSAYQQEKLELYLDSLVETGELNKKDQKYFITGRAINTVERYEEEERRHRDSTRMQRRIVWLTLLIALFALMQSDVVEIPTLVDLSHSDEAR